VEVHEEELIASTGLGVEMYPALGKERQIQAGCG